MSHKNGNRTVGDNARREAKLLANTPACILDPFGGTELKLKQPYPKELGEYAVVVIATPMTAIQFTIARPVGFTDLDPNADWVAHRSDQLKGILARADDPDQASINQSRANTRTELAIAKGYLVKREAEGKTAVFFEGYPSKSRNDLLESARTRHKEVTSEIKGRIAALGKEEKAEKAELNAKLQRIGDPIEHLPDGVREKEAKLREFWNLPETVDLMEAKHPQKYRTLSGPYYTLPQAAIPGAKGKRLEDVAISFGRNIASVGMKPKPAAPEGRPGAEAALDPETGSAAAETASDQSGKRTFSLLNRKKN